MIQLATIGTSFIASEFVQACKLSGRVRIVAVYSRDFDRGHAFAAQVGCTKVYTDLLQMANDPEIQAVYIASPNSMHVAQSKLFIKHHKHVLCEKPLVTSEKEYIELKTLADKNQVIYLDAMMSIHCQSHHLLMSAIDQIGSIAMARINFCQLSSRYSKYLSGEQVNVFDKQFYGGVLMDLGVFCVYAALDLFGMPKNIQAVASYLENGTDKAGIAIFSYDALNVVLSYSKVGQSEAPTEIVGDQGTIKIGSVSQYNDLVLVKDGKETVLFKEKNKAQIMAGEVVSFADFIENYEVHKEQYILVSELANKVYRCMDLIKLSAQIKYE